MLFEVILIAFGAGVVGSLVGGIIGVVIKKSSKTYISMMLGFAAGAMMGVALFELLPEAYEHGGIWATLFGTLLGVLFIFLLGTLTKKNENESVSDKKKLKRMGILIFFAMALHSVPEGLAIGAGEHLGIGLLLGVIFFLHFIPEGLAIAVPMKASGVKVWKILTLCFVAGATTIIGAIIGYYIGMVDVLLSYCLSFAAGAMLYVALSEMLPTAYSYSNSHKSLSAVIISAALLIIVFSFIL